MVRSFAVFFILFCSLLTQASLNAGMWDTVKSWFANDILEERPPTIRILIADDLDNAELQVQGRYALYDPYTEEHISHRFLGKTATIEAIRSGLKWEEEFPGIYQLKIVPLDPTTLIQVNGTDYRGNLYIYDTGGTISLVNEIDLEDYLSCTLPFSLNESFPREAMAAMVITARTNAYYQVKHPRNTFWAVDAEEIGFHGCSVPRLSSIDEAIRATRYMVLSTSSPYEGSPVPFLSSWGPMATLRPSDREVQGKITLEQACEVAERGAHAAQILGKAFPGSHIMLTKAPTATS